MLNGVKLCADSAVFSRSMSGSGIRPLSARYPSGPQAFSAVNSDTYSLMPGTTPTWAFFT